VNENLLKADEALNVVREANNKPAAHAGALLLLLARSIQNTGHASQDVEIAQADAWLAVSTLHQILDSGGTLKAEDWRNAQLKLEVWKSSIS